MAWKASPARVAMSLWSRAMIVVVVPLTPENMLVLFWGASSAPTADPPSMGRCSRASVQSPLPSARLAAWWLRGGALKTMGLPACRWLLGTEVRVHHHQAPLGTCRPSSPPGTSRSPFSPTATCRMLVLLPLPLQPPAVSATRALGMVQTSF